MVMLVPPGVGRRKRDATENFCYSNKAFLQVNMTNMALKYCDEFLFNITYQPLNKEFINEIPLGIIMTLNAMNVAQDLKFESCQTRNFCEFGLNCGFFGSGSKAICSVGSKIMSRWFSVNEKEESDFFKGYF